MGLDKELGYTIYFFSSGCSAVWFSAPASGVGGRGFESHHPDHNFVARCLSLVARTKRKFARDRGFEADPNVLSAPYPTHFT